MYNLNHDDDIKWKHFPRYWTFVRGIHRSRWIPRTKASGAELWCFRWSAPELSKQPWGWWLETPSWSLWRQCNTQNKNSICNEYTEQWYTPFIGFLFNHKEDLWFSKGIEQRWLIQGELVFLQQNHILIDWHIFDMVKPRIILDNTAPQKRNYQISYCGMNSFWSL